MAVRTKLRLVPAPTTTVHAAGVGRLVTERARASGSSVVREPGTGRVWLPRGRGNGSAPGAASTLPAYYTPGHFGAAELQSQNWPSASESSYSSFLRFESGCSGLDPLDFVEMVADPLWGRVLRLHHFAGEGCSVTYDKGIFTGTDKTWYLRSVRYSPNWTPAGTTGPSSGDAYKMSHVHFVGGGTLIRGRMDVENGDDWNTAFQDGSPGSGIDFQNTRCNDTGVFPSGLPPGMSYAAHGVTDLDNANFQGIATPSGEYVEILKCYERVTPTLILWRAWVRIATTGGGTTWSPGSWYFVAAWSCSTVNELVIPTSGTGDVAPMPERWLIGVNRNRNPDVDMYLEHGWNKIVDGTQVADPFGVESMRPLHHGAYATSFAGTENPLSEGDRWTQGKVTGLDWCNTASIPGLGYGVHDVAGQFRDPTSIIKGHWGRSQEISGVIFRDAANPPTNDNPECTLRLLSSIGANVNQGYEAIWSLRTTGAYMEIVRWNGALGSFTILDRFDGVSSTDGTVCRFTVWFDGVNQTLKLFRNGTLRCEIVDNTFIVGAPGFGTYRNNQTTTTAGHDQRYGWKNVSASNLFAAV